MAREKARPAPATRKSPKGQARRRQILDAASRLFSEGGYHTASLADIAAAAGISQPGLLHHFGSKSELLLAVLRDRDERNLREEDMGTRTGTDYINGYLHILARSDANPGLIQLSAMISAEGLSAAHPAHDYFVDSYSSRIETMALALADVFDRAALPPGVTAETIARWAIALSDGMRYQLLYEEGGVDRAGIVAHFFESLRPYMHDQTSPISATLGEDEAPELSA